MRSFPELTRHVSNKAQEPKPCSNTTPCLAHGILHRIWLLLLLRDLRPHTKGSYPEPACKGTANTWRPAPGQNLRPGISSCKEQTNYGHFFAPRHFLCLCTFIKYLYWTLAQTVSCKIAVAPNELWSAPLPIKNAPLPKHIA